MTSMVNGLLNGVNAPNFGFGGLGGFGNTPTKTPTLDRWEEMHGYSKPKGGKKNSVALSALTLLAFLFFLNILQNCLQDHMEDMKGKNKMHGMNNGMRRPSNVVVVTMLPSGTARGDFGEYDTSAVENREAVGTKDKVATKKRIIKKRKNLNTNQIKKNQKLPTENN